MFEWNDARLLDCLHLHFPLMNRELRQDKCVTARINRLETLIKSWPKLPEKVFFVSTLKRKVSSFSVAFVKIVHNLANKKITNCTHMSWLVVT